MHKGHFSQQWGEAQLVTFWTAIALVLDRLGASPSGPRPLDIT